MDFGRALIWQTESSLLEGRLLDMFDCGRTRLISASASPLRQCCRIPSDGANLLSSSVCPAACSLDGDNSSRVAAAAHLWASCGRGVSMGCRVSRERRRSRGLGVDQFARRRQLVGAWTEKCIVNNTNVDGLSAECIAISSVAGATRLGSVVEVRGQGGSAPPAPI